MTDDRSAFEAARAAGKARQHEQRLARSDAALAADMRNVESTVHRALAKHAPYEVCAECPLADRVLVQLAKALDPEAFDEAQKRSQQPAAVVQWTARRHMAYKSAEKVLRPLVEAVDLCWKATPYGATEDGDTAAYIVPKGAVHRLVGALQGIGVSASLRANTAPEETPCPRSPQRPPSTQRW